MKMLNMIYKKDIQFTYTTNQLQKNDQQKM